jgi:hypothetical protein
MQLNRIIEQRDVRDEKVRLGVKSTALSEPPCMMLFAFGSQVAVKHGEWPASKLNSTNVQRHKAHTPHALLFLSFCSNFPSFLRHIFASTSNNHIGVVFLRSESHSKCVPRLIRPDCVDHHPSRKQSL